MSVTSFPNRRYEPPPPQLTAEEAKCIRIALIFGDPAIGPRPDPDPRLEKAKAKLKEIERHGQ